MLKKLCYFNLTFSAINAYFIFNQSHGFFGYSIGVFLIMCIWYNWNLIQQLKGLKSLNRQHKILAIGAFIISLTFFTIGYHQLYTGINLNERGFAFLGIFNLMFGLSQLSQIVFEYKRIKKESSAKSLM